MSSSADSKSPQSVDQVDPSYHIIPPKPGTKRPHCEDGHLSPTQQPKRSKHPSADSHSTATTQPLEIHRITCAHHPGHAKETYYADTPKLFAGDSKATALHGQNVIKDDIFGDEFADDNPHISFIVLKSYDCKAYHDLVKDRFIAMSIPPSVAKNLTEFKSHFSVLHEDGEVPEPEKEKIFYVSRDMQMAMKIIRAAHPEHFQSEEMSTSLDAPYLCIYHARSILEGYCNQSESKISDEQQSHIRCLVDYIHHTRHHEFDEADSEFVNGMVSVRHFPKLFGPNDIVVQNTNAGPIAHTVKEAHYDGHAFVLACWTWEYDGIFYKSHSTWRVEWPSHAGEAPVSNLSMYPLKYDKAGVGEVLLKRGTRFWEFRKAVLVEYESESSAFELKATRNRYMVDLNTYRQMHPEAIQAHSHEHEGLEKEEFPPDDQFLLLLPNQVRGYGFHDKKWSKLSVALTQAVSWNGETFDRQLVLKVQKKELIKALITVHTAPSKQHRSDIIEGKGKGLILLLHGGPGTGKTLTAESIAEFAERPLYRVTCGDIGTDAESVEKYLESVLYIGTLWGCVVLLDEADVFLEERTPTDLQRNALVSVFLRALEYFEGIMILTSNRVGTFDEAFKSRVQLAMHYPPLNLEGRWKIWNMFFRDMLDKDETLKYQGLKDQLDALARHKLNGRQIRNIINTARQLARYRKESLAYTHVEQALDVVNEFEQYVSDMRGYTDDEYAKSQGHR